MDSWKLHSLGKALYELEKLGPLLDDLLLPSQCGFSEGRGGSGQGSRPPLRIPILDVKWETERLLTHWAWGCAVKLNVVPPYSRSVHSVAAWLQCHLIDIGDLDEADAIAEQVISQSELLSEMFASDDDGAITAPKQGTCREIAAICKGLGYGTSKTTIHRWAHEGAIASQTMEDGRVIVDLQEVLDKLATCNNAM